MCEIPLRGYIAPKGPCLHKHLKGGEGGGCVLTSAMHLQTEARRQAELLVSTIMTLIKGALGLWFRCATADLRGPTREVELQVTFSACCAEYRAALGLGS